MSLTRMREQFANFIISDSVPSPLRRPLVSSSWFRSIPSRFPSRYILVIPPSRDRDAESTRLRDIF
ncbi:hypothetical protein AKJ16_DCAP02221 [Drosera capensis]